MRREASRIVQFAAIAAVTALGFSANAGTITTPIGLSPGSQFVVIDVTAATTTGDAYLTASGWNGFVETDAVTQGFTSYGGQTVSWGALASIVDETTAIGQFNPSVPVYNTQGQLIASDGASLWNTGSNDLDNTVAPGSSAYVWTGSFSDGTAASVVDSKALGAGFVEYGLAGSTDSTWVEDGFALTEPPTTPPPTYAVYGFSNVLTVPTPLPSPLLSALGLGALLGLGRLTARRSGWI